MNTTVISFAGNLAADPELRFTTGGRSVTEFRVMVNRRVRNEAGDWSDAEPTAHNCKLWGQEAENFVESVTKGHRVVVVGHVETEAWEDRDSGEKRRRDVVNVDEVGVSTRYAIAQPRKIEKRTEHAEAAGGAPAQ